MKDRYISKTALLQMLDGYLRVERWNAKVCDMDTVLRVLEVLRTEVNRMDGIGSRQLSSKLLAAKDSALEFYEKSTHMDVSRYQKLERSCEAVGNDLLTGYYRGLRVQSEMYGNIFKRLLGPEVEK